MKNTRRWVWLSSFCWSVALFTAIIQPLSVSAVPWGRAPERVLVRPYGHVGEGEVQAILRAHGARQTGHLPSLNVRILNVPEDRIETVLAALARNPKIEFAEPDRVYAPDLLPNDPLYVQEWHLPKIQAPQAWDVTPGRASVVIAILDSGVDGTHPDLAAKLVPGWNVYDNNADTADVTGHGTPVASVAAAATHNGLGIASVAWGCMIQPVRVTSATGVALSSDIAKGLVWAADQGTRVANISFSASTSATVQSAAQYFFSKGGVVTVSAGNDGTSSTAPDNAYVLAISATDENDLVPTWSSTGTHIDLSAPGSNLKTALRGGTYGTGNGTSGSAPIVAAVAALVLSVNPALTPDQVQNILKQSADDLGTAGWDSRYGWGRVNAYKAVLAAVNQKADVQSPVVSLTAAPAGSIVSGIVPVTVTATDNLGIQRIEFYVDNTLLGSSSAAQAVFSWDTSKLSNGAHTLQARAYDPTGNVGLSPGVVLNVQNGPPADTVPPVCQVTSPAGGTTVAGTAKIGVSATDNVGVTRTEWYLNGILMAGSTTIPAVFAWDTTKQADGTYMVSGRAYDAAGNAGSSTAVQVTVRNAVADLTAPTVQVLSPASDVTIVKTLTVSISSTDNVAVGRVDVLIDGKVYATSTSANPVFNLNLAKLSKGTHTLHAAAYDKAGNCGKSAAVTVRK